MRAEILVATELLAAHRRTLVGLSTEANGLILLIRSMLFPYEEDVTALRIDETASSAQRLSEIVHAMKTLKGKITELEIDLGCET